LFRLPAESKGLKLVVEVDPAVPRYLSGDPTRLRQILSNLVGNAVKFTERGAASRCLRVGVWRRRTVSGGVRSSRCSDTGIGIELREGARADASSPSSQADASTTRRFGGTGLGLAITRRARGRSRAAPCRQRARPRRRGSTFRLRAPAAERVTIQDLEPLSPTSARARIQARRHGDARAARRGQRRQPPRDDRPHARASSGAQVDVAARTARRPSRRCARGALRRGAHGLPDAGDGRLRGDGEDPSARSPQWRSDAHRGPHGQRDRRTIASAASPAGMDDFLSKPISKDALEAMLARWGGD
jgi:CheY-like chemotaxis protein